MCLYSLSAMDANIRKAKVGESLTRGDYRQHACFLGDDGMLACIRPGTKVEIAELRLSLRETHGDSPMVSQPDGSSLARKVVMEWNNKHNVRGTFVRWVDHHRGYSADAILFEDGLYIHMGWLQKGVQMRIPRKVRKDKGVHKRNLDKALGLDQIRAELLSPVTEKVSV